MADASAETISREHPRRLLAACVLLVAAPILCHCLVFEAGVGGADGWSYLANVESLTLDRDLDLTNNRIEFPDGYPARPYTFEEPTGRWVTHEPLGPALIDAPFYALARLATRSWSPSIKLEREPYSVIDGRRLLAIFAVSFSHNLQAAAAMLLVFATLLEIGASPLAAAGAALLVFFGGPLHFYACNGLSHAPAALAMAGVVYMASRVVRHRTEGRRCRWELFVLGAVIGLGSVMRYVSGAVVVPVAMCLFVFRFSDECRARGDGPPGRSWAAWLGSAVLDQIVLAAGCWSVAWITLAYWRVQFGAWTGNPHATPARFRQALWPPPLSKILLSPRHGFFRFSPLFLLAAAGLGQLLLWPNRAPKALVRLALLCAGSFAIVALVYDSFHEWHGSGTYSTRFLTECVVLLAPALWWFLERSEWLGSARVRWALAAVLAGFAYALFLLTRAGLLYQDAHHRMGQSLGDYTYVFRERVPLGEVFRRIGASSYTLSFMARRPVLLATFVLAWVGVAALVFVVWPRERSACL